MPHKDQQSRAGGQRLTAEEVGARVGAILGDAEREAREIIAAARSEGVDASLPPQHSFSEARFDDLTRAFEDLSARFDAFELATAAHIEALSSQLRDALAGVERPAAAAAEPSAPYRPASPAPVLSEEESSQLAAARVRAIDLALAGYSREAIANELSTSLHRGQVELLLEEVLVG
ncbi:MAG TPA: hypothetical protein VGG41_01535 [Solirubrobacteraceae bacterium]